MFVSDRLTLDAPKRTRDGYLAVRAKVARTGTYDYAGTEVDPKNEHGLRDKAVVKVFRPGDEVFDRASLASFIGKPITSDHPTTPVTADNWRDHARGTIMGAVREGEYVAFDLLLTDKAAISAVESGKRELSNGYATDLKFEPGTAPDGTAYDAVQTSIQGNHIALVDRGRAGPECRIGDTFAACDSNPAALADLLPKGNAVKKIVLDGLQVDLSDADAVSAAISKLQDKATAAETALTDANARAEKAEGEKAALQTQLDEAKAASDPLKLDQIAADRAELIAAAKAAHPALDAKGKSAADIRKEVVVAKLGDKAPTTDAAIEGAFAVLTSDAKPAAAGIVSITPAANTNDAASVRDLARASQY